jgi:hypothetical protein
MSSILGQHHVKTVIITDVITTTGEFWQEHSSNIIFTVSTHCHTI